MAPAIAITAPTDRSMPRVAITSTMPSDNSATGAPRLNTSTRLPNSRPSCRRRSKNCGETARSTIRMTTSAKTWATPRRGRRKHHGSPLIRARTGRSAAMAARMLGHVDRVPVQLIDMDAVAQHDRPDPNRSRSRRSPRKSRAAPVPSPHSSRIRRMISAWAPTSMPRVGSSRISRRGSVASQRASSAFCWLPPDNSPIGRSGSGGRMSNSLMKRSAISSCSPRDSGSMQSAPGLQRQHDVLAHGEIGDDALRLALLGAIAEAVAARRRAATAVAPARPRP